MVYSLHLLVSFPQNRCSRAFIFMDYFVCRINYTHRMLGAQPPPSPGGGADRCTVPTHAINLLPAWDRIAGRAQDGRIRLCHTAPRAPAGHLLGQAQVHAFLCHVIQNQRSHVTPEHSFWLWRELSL